ncbi:hypothetical protein RclHR1_07220014 [Rhizophagus clarus]|uniref:Uncharacterized protein n=1 Tax=Rhizophagus clarus TaxID=94130 RepID=A0A2Z6SCC8_9GLOM|nr:hypothetical protein RclHR1_07220014 [Rhizophagus clarus]GES98758.1 hypothetical protein RCL_e24561_RclHR1_07220014 [Rhizophagus clarus]
MLSRRPVDITDNNLPDNTYELMLYEGSESVILLYENDSYRWINDSNLQHDLIKAHDELRQIYYAENILDIYTDGSLYIVMPY